jgi:hypothetical protein
MVLQTHRPSPPNVFGYPTLDSGAFNEWKAQALVLLSTLAGSGHVYADSFREATSKGPYISAAKSGVGILRGVLEDLQAGMFQTSDAGALQREPLLLLDQICSRFHLVARQLRSRHAGRATLSVTDEYDVQDLLHSLLWLNFEDIRPEEYSPSCAGKASRLDFLLKIEQIVVETKKTRPTLDAAALGGELIEDIARYQQHPDCSALVCFVYDPDGFIANPRGVENDLNRNEPIPVRVFIRPK